MQLQQNLILKRKMNKENYPYPMLIKGSIWNDPARQITVISNPF